LKARPSTAPAVGFPRHGLVRKIASAQLEDLGAARGRIARIILGQLGYLPSSSSPPSSSGSASLVTRPKIGPDTNMLVALAKLTAPSAYGNVLKTGVPPQLKSSCNSQLKTSFKG
jgi:hypothetical protein